MKHKDLKRLVSLLSQAKQLLAETSVDQKPHNEQAIRMAHSLIIRSLDQLRLLE